MRILFLLTQDLDSPSGLGRYWPMACALAARGHQVRIVTLHSDWTDLIVKKSVRENVEVNYVAPMHVMKSGSQKTYYSPIQLVRVILQATFSLSKAALSSPVDIIYIGKPHPMNSIAGVLAAKIKGSILCLDCDDYEAGSNRFIKKWQMNVVAYFEKNVPAFTRLVTTNTHFMKAKLLSWEIPDKRILYLPNGIDCERFMNVKQDDVNRLRSNIGLDGKRVVLYLGSLSLSNHPVDLLIKAFKIVSQECSNATLLLVGGGEDYQELINQAYTNGISQSTIFTGRIEPKDVPLYYALADVSVDPVYDDFAARGRSPLKLFESWVCGVPFISSPVGDREYLLKLPPAGLLIEPAGDFNALADGILQILHSDSLANELRIRGLEQVVQYTWDRLVLELEQEFQKLL